MGLSSISCTLQYIWFLFLSPFCSANVAHVAAYFHVASLFVYLNCLTFFKWTLKHTQTHKHSTHLWCNSIAMLLFYVLLWLKAKNFSSSFPVGFFHLRCFLVPFLFNFSLSLSLFAAFPASFICWVILVKSRMRNKCVARIKWATTYKHNRYIQQR